MDKVILDAISGFNQASISWGMINSGVYGKAPATFEQLEVDMRKKLSSINAFSQSYWKQINGATNIIKNAVINTGGSLSEKIEVCPFIMVFAKVLSTPSRPQKKVFIDLFKCIYYKEYGIIDPLSLPLGLGLMDSYSNIIQNDY